MEDYASSADNISIGKAFLIYLLCIAVAIGSGFINWIFFIVVYIVCGIYLTKWILPKLVEWHPMYNTVQNVFEAKMGFIFLWFVQYPVLFFKLAVTKYL